MTETDIILEAEEIGTEIVPAPSGTLFHSEDPVEIISKATRLAEALSKVLRDQKLTANIQGKEHVLVEGWTLLGTMLGVFPVLEWTRPLPDGWEARVVARTMSGQAVGAAEAECLRSERSWKTRDDYALRSMAQTRATSKALRQPLGFVVTLAGFEATPAEEMPRDSAPSDKQADQRVEGPKPLTAPNSWAKWEEMISAYDQQVHDWFVAFSQASARYLFGPDIDTKKLSASDKKLLLQKAAGAVILVRENFEPTELPYPGLEDVRGAFAMVMDGVELAIPDVELDAEAAEAADRD
jgi:hypothetical protein